MNEVIKALEERRSIRKFKSDMPSKEDIDQIIEAGLYAASGMGKQSSIVVAVTNKELRDKISVDNRKVGGWDGEFDPFYGAPVILIVLADRNVGTYLYDGSLTMGNLMNAAHSLGLGSIWIHRAKEEFEQDFYKDLLKKRQHANQENRQDKCDPPFPDPRFHLPLHGSTPIASSAKRIPRTIG